MTLLSLSDLTVRRSGCPVVDRAALDVGPGEFVGLIGPNGAGKTTLLRAALGLVPGEGASSLLGLDPVGRARHAAWMPQVRQVAWSLSVEDVVALGRLPHGRGTEADRVAVDRALARLELEGFRRRDATRLSGGEQARVLIARLLAQETPLILADEPIAGLDPAHQIATMELFADLAREGRGLVVALHDLALAARHCTRLVLMSEGRIVADGAPASVLTGDNLRAHFGVAGRLEGSVFTLDGRVPADA